jgi:hypothetical protein
VRSGAMQRKRAGRGRTHGLEGGGDDQSRLAGASAGGLLPDRRSGRRGRRRRVDGWRRGRKKMFWGEGGRLCGVEARDG